MTSNHLTDPLSRWRRLKYLVQPRPVVTCHSQSLLATPPSGYRRRTMTSKHLTDLLGATKIG